MQTTYQVTCKCGHIFPIPARFLSLDEDERTALLKALEGLPCADCIRADVEKTCAMREDFQEMRELPPRNTKFPISEDAWKAWRALNITELGWRDLAKDHSIPEEVINILAWIDRWNRYHPVGTEVFILPPGDEQPPGLLGAKTTSPARMHHGKAVVDVKGHGMINLDRLIDMTTTDEPMNCSDG